MRNLHMNNSSAAGARTLASKVFAVLMSVILVLGLSPVTKVSYASAVSDAASAAQANAESVDSEGNGKAVASDDGVDAAGKAASGASDESSANAADAASSSNQVSTAASGSNNSAEPASNQEGIALASANDSVEPGKYGQFNYSKNSTKDAFSSDSAYSAYHDTNAEKWLGVAGNFHITAFNNASLQADVYGNVLAKNLTQCDTFGLPSSYSDRYGNNVLSYIQNYQAGGNNNDKNQNGLLVLGSGNTVTTEDNGNALAINGSKMNSPYNVVQDEDTSSAPFIDLDAVKSSAIEKSNYLSGFSDSERGASVAINGGQATITYTADSGCAFVTLNASTLSGISDLFIDGLHINGDEKDPSLTRSIVINVNMDVDDLALTRVKVRTESGSSAGAGEADSTVGYVLFNIMNSTGQMNIKTCDSVLASILAPNANIDLYGSSAGTYIGNNVTVHSESHARPFRGTLQPVTTSAKVTKQWLNAYGSTETGVDHDAVKVQLYQSKNGGDWTKYGDEVELSNANSWSYDWGSSLPKKDTDGATYEYKVEEVSKTADYNATVSKSDDGWTVTNRHVAVGKLSVSKAWKDAAGNEEPGEHSSVTVRVMRSINGTDFEQYGESIQLSKGNNWSATVDQLPLNDADGKEYTYKVEEDVPDGYAASYDMTSATDADGNKSWSYTITNKKNTTSVKVTKEWSDSNNQDGIRPASVSVDVLQSAGNGEAKTVKTLTLSADNGWTATADDLPVNGIDGAYAYSISEAEVEGYTSSVATEQTADGTWSFKLTNTHETEKVKVDVKKVWDDGDNKDLLRTSSVTAQLYAVAADGTLTAVEGKTAELNDGNNWIASWENLPVNKDGKEIKYTVRETEVPNGYTVTYQGVDNKDGSYTFTMTNTHEAVEGEFSLSGYSMQAAAAPVSEAEKVCYVDPKVVKVLDGRALKAGEFSFQLIDDATGEVKSSASNDASGMVDFDAANPQTSDGMEPCCLAFTAKGTYSYTVREDPSQVKDSTVEYSTEVVKFVVVIDEGADGALVENDSYYLKYASAADAAAGTQATKYASTDHPAITNTVKPLSISLTKTSADTGECLAGAVYGLYKVDESAPEGEVRVMSATSNSEGVMTFTNIDAGAVSEGSEFFFREISAPAGYAVSENKTQTFTIQQVSDGEYQLVYADGTVSKAAAGTAAAPLVAADVTDSLLSITFGKVSSDGTPLSGAKLAVRDAAGNDVDAWETDTTGHVVNSLEIGKTYVLYEKQAPEGYQTAADVTFKVDEYGKVAIVSGASSNDVMNAYATGSTLNLVDYKQTELVEKKETVREEGVTAKKSALAKTSDQTPFVPITALALGAIAVAAVAYRRTKRC